MALSNQAIQQAIQSIGSLLIIGFDGTTLSSRTAAFIHDAQIGGVLLFTRNYQGPDQVRRLINGLQNARGSSPSLLIAVDQEGGRVQRFRDGFTRLPTAAAVAQKPEFAHELAQLIARELKSVGVNLNFSPVADIMTQPANPVIGDRAYGTDTKGVNPLVRATVAGLQTQRVLSCLKHFPGHGDTHLDSHYELPHVDTPLTTLRSREFLPFQEGFAAGCELVMTAHLIAQCVDSELPATLSARMLKGILREELGFTGLIISDDLEMKAITDHYGVNDTPQKAIEAGCELLIYRSEDVARQAHASLVRALQEGQLDPQVVLQAVEKVTTFKQRNARYLHAEDQSLDVLRSPAHLELVRRIDSKLEP